MSQANRTVWLIGEIGVERHEKMKLATDEKFEKLKGSIVVTERREESRITAGVGTLSYSGEAHGVDYDMDATYSVYIELPEPRFDLVFSAIRSGQMPSQITLEIEGMDYDWHPDGSGKIWDNKASPKLLIKSVAFVAPIIGGDPDEFLDERTAEDGIPPSRAQLKEITAILNQFTVKIISGFRWMIVLFLILIAVWFFRLR